MKIKFNCKKCGKKVKTNNSSALDIEQKCSGCFNAHVKG